MLPLVEPGPPLTRDETQRYARHLLLSHLGELGQRRIRAASVAVVGAGGLGSPVLLYLAAAGVGRVGIIDDDTVDVSNLQRQIVHADAAVGQPKALSAADAVRRANPGVRVDIHQLRLSPENAADVLGRYDLIIDGSDNFDTRYLVNDTCAQLGLPFVWASLMRTQAQVSVFWRAPSDGSVGVDLRDLFPVPPNPADVPACGDVGVLGALCGQVGSMMVNEALKLITGTGRTLLGRVVVIDSLEATQYEIPLAPRDRSHDVSLVQDDASPATCSPATPMVDFMSVQALAARLGSPQAPLVLDVREPGEVAIAAVANSVRIPVDQIMTGRYPQISRSTPIVVHCKTGSRAIRAAVALQDAGFEDVSVLEGGILAWIDQIEPNLPTY